MESNVSDIAPPLREKEDRGGIGLAIIFIASTLGILLLTFVSQAVIWFIGEAVFYGYKIPDLRWLVSAGFSLGVIIPAGIIQALVSNRFHKRVYRTLFQTGLFSFALTPVHFAGITSTQLTNLLQMIFSSLFFAGLWLWNRRRFAIKADFFSRPLASSLYLAAAGAFTAGYFWLAWGAFGSVLDILLNLLAGVLLAGVIILILKFSLFEPSDEGKQAYPWTDFLLFGFIAALVMMIVATAFGHNGSQMYLLAVLPVFGWPTAAFLGRKGENARLWPPLLLAGLAAAWPMMLVDPDELSSIINSGLGELIEVSVRAALGTIGIGMIIAILAIIKPRFSGRLAGALAAAAIATGVVIYGLAGTPGLFGERLFVIMKTQADLAPLVEVQPVEERRARVYELLTKEAMESQSGLRTSLDKLNIPYTPYYLVNGLEVDGGPFVKLWLESRPDVDRVLDSPRLRPLPNEIPVNRGEATRPEGLLWNLEMIKADRVWDEFGVTGKGIIIGQSDSGVDGTHSELADSYRGRDGKHDFNWYDPWAGTVEPEDRNGHGTHTLGTILGNRVGIAPDAEWIACANLQRNLGNPAVYLDCMQFMLAPFPQHGNPFRDAIPEWGANVMNNSWGCPVVEGCDPGTFLQAVRALRTAGVFMVVSTGNSGDGGCGSVADPPAIYEEVLSVGAVDVYQQRTSFSSMGPVTVDGSNRVKPDIMAPGGDVFSAYPGGTYEEASGTSMAGPHLTGVVALMWSANPELVGDIDRTTRILQDTAMKIMDLNISCGEGGAYPSNATGYGIVDAYEAVKQALIE